MYCHKHLQTGLTIGLTYGILCIVDGGKPPTNTGARRERRKHERGHDTA
nr:MAG TPA: hypothetical protein [Caudoviricetes sp.]